jgi:hypothetical protein
MFALFLLPLLVGACGTTPRPAAPAAPKAPAVLAARALEKASETSPLERPYTARHVLAYGHAVARLLDTKAAFTSLTGTRIGVNGEPVRGGEWQLTYVGTEPVAQAAKKGSNPYQQIYRRITVVIPADGKPRVDNVEAEGMPLGQCFYDAPMPEVDSNHVIERARTLRPGDPGQGGYRLVLAGLMTQSHFQELVWKVSRATQGTADRPLMIHASTGEPILR